MRVFLDTNVLVAAEATRGLCTDVVRVVLKEHELVVGERLLVELERTLGPKIGFSPDLIRDSIQFLRQRAAEVVSVEVKLRGSEVDPDDAWILAEAKAGRVEVFVTGDKALLKADVEVPFDRVSPRKFWERLRGGSGPAQ